MKSVLTYLNKEEKKMREQTDKLRDALTRLKYESRLFEARNLLAAQDAVEKLSASFLRHKNLQENVLFPFLEAHIPRQEPTIHFLSAEHVDIQMNKERLVKEVCKAAKKKGHEGKVKAYEKGIYFLALFEQHICFEHTSIRQTLCDDLTTEEKSTIAKRVKNWMQKKSGGGDGHE